MLANIAMLAVVTTANHENRKLLNKRALMCLGWILLVDVALCCLFIFVPGIRL